MQQGTSVAEAARLAGTSRQSVYTWLERDAAEGLAGLTDRPRRPKTSPTKLPVAIEAAICALRRDHPRWGAQRIAFELAQNGTEPLPTRSTVYRVLQRHGLINRQEQNHRRRWKRWQREAPMQLWQLDIMGGVMLADGREAKLITGIDDCSRFMVIAAVAEYATSGEVCRAFIEAMRRYGSPNEVLTDNGKQFTGRFIKPVPVEVLFERICREHGIANRLTKPRSPTTTGKIERFHKTIRAEFLHSASSFAGITVAQQVISTWIETYNRKRPHQALGMRVPAEVFRPHDPVTGEEFRLEEPRPVPVGPPPPRITPKSRVVQQTGVYLDDDVHAVEFESVLTPSARLCLLASGHSIKFAAAMAGKAVTVWADDRSIHVLVDGEVIRTRPSCYSPSGLVRLLERGARKAGPEPAAKALPDDDATASSGVVEVERRVGISGLTQVGGAKFFLRNRDRGLRPPRQDQIDLLPPQAKLIGEVVRQVLNLSSHC